MHDANALRLTQIKEPESLTAFYQRIGGALAFG
jgi:hypothetical protein